MNESGDDNDTATNDEKVPEIRTVLQKSSSKMRGFVKAITSTKAKVIAAVLGGAALTASGVYLIKKKNAEDKSVDLKYAAKRSVANAR